MIGVAAVDPAGRARAEQDANLRLRARQAVAGMIATALSKTRWTKEQLALEVGITTSTLRRWEAQQVMDFSLLNIAKLCLIAGGDLNEAIGIRVAETTAIAELAEAREENKRYKGILDMLLSTTDPKEDKDTVAAYRATQRDDTLLRQKVLTTMSEVVERLVQSEIAQGEKDK
jgi:transcriptional regulator with XRE-family HTH domain